jgi:hypothetical protein
MHSQTMIKNSAYLRCTSRMSLYLAFSLIFFMRTPLGLLYLASLFLFPSPYIDLCLPSALRARG